MNFLDIAYERPDIEIFRAHIEGYLEEFISAQCIEEQSEIIKSINALRNEALTSITVASIRYMTDMSNEDYKAENEYVEHIWPVYQNLEVKYHKALMESKYREDLEKAYGKQLFNIAAASRKTVNDEVLEDLVQEQKLESEYVKLLASARINFDEKVLNVTQLHSYLSSKDRDIRKSAAEEIYSFMESIEERLDLVFDSLVKLRTQIVNKLGYKNFIEFCYVRLGRTDYDEALIKQFRDHIATYIVPLTVKLREIQRNSLQLDALKFYDENLKPYSKNEASSYSTQWIKEQAGNILGDISEEAKELYQYLDSNNYMDLFSRMNKAGGAYTTFLSSCKLPFIFANFNGTQKDMRILMHEFGHAFQMYKACGNDIPEYLVPTKDAVELHSIVMEYLTAHKMAEIYYADINKFMFEFFEEAMHAIPLRACVDEFQHIVYSDIRLTIKQRKEIWRALEKKYLPYKNYEDNSYLEGGSAWHLQGHIFRYPFYSISYNLNQICAIQFFEKSHENRVKAWEQYIKLCEAGGSKTFPELFSSSGITSPFEEEAFISVCRVVEKYILC